MPQNLFDENFRWTNTASEINKDFFKAITPLFEKYIKQGVSPRDLSIIDEETSSVLGAGLAEYRATILTSD